MLTFSKLLSFFLVVTPIWLPSVVALDTNLASRGGKFNLVGAAGGGDIDLAEMAEAMSPERLAELQAALTTDPAAGSDMFAPVRNDHHRELQSSEWDVLRPIPEEILISRFGGRQDLFLGIFGTMVCIVDVTAGKDFLIIDITTITTITIIDITVVKIDIMWLPDCIVIGFWNGLLLVPFDPLPLTPLGDWDVNPDDAEAVSIDDVPDVVVAKLTGSCTRVGNEVWISAVDNSDGVGFVVFNIITKVFVRFVVLPPWVGGPLVIGGVAPFWPNPQQGIIIMTNQGVFLLTFTPFELKLLTIPDIVGEIKGCVWFRGKFFVATGRFIFCLVWVDGRFIVDQAWNPVPTTQTRFVVVIRLTRITIITRRTIIIVRIKGDPHLVTWSGEKGDFHGECDLMLLSSRLQGGENLNIHIRTKIIDDFSYIFSTALQIDNDVLELHKKNRYYINGELNGELTTIGGYPVDMDDQYFTIHLGNDEDIVLKSGMMLAVDLKNPSMANFGDSVGLFGDFHTGKKLARDGETDLEDWDAFGMEWQVLETEPMLFREIKGPQLPDNKCKMPDPAAVKAARKRRKLRGLSKEAAEDACANAHPDDFEFCVTDVLATNDLDMAKEYN